jgi:hypothetical protein
VFHNEREFLENQHDYPEKSPCSQFIKLTSQTTQNKTLSTFTVTSQQQETGISGSQLLKTPGRDAGRRAIKKQRSTHKHTIHKFIEFGSIKQLDGSPTVSGES